MGRKLPGIRAKVIPRSNAPRPLTPKILNPQVKLSQLVLACAPQLQAFAVFCALARDGSKAANLLESKGAFAALQQAMKQSDGRCKKGTARRLSLVKQVMLQAACPTDRPKLAKRSTLCVEASSLDDLRVDLSSSAAATDAWVTLNEASGEVALPRVTETLLNHDKEHDSLLGAAAGALAKIVHGDTGRSVFSLLFCRARGGGGSISCDVLCCSSCFEPRQEPSREARPGLCRRGAALAAR
jgi:hypothetical protein